MRRTPLTRRTPLKSTGRIQPRARRRPEVDWDAVREQVFRRDLRAVMRYFRALFGVDELLAHFNGRLIIDGLTGGTFEACVATILDPDEQGNCSGRWTMNHVQNPGDPMHSRKVPDEPGYLVSLCEWHHQGMKAGHVWATASENIQKQWDYLKEQRDADQATE